MGRMSFTQELKRLTTGSEGIQSLGRTRGTTCLAQIAPT